MASTPGPWTDRRAAGRELGTAVAAELGDRSAALVLGLPRGGVVVAAEVARVLGAELDVLVVRKVGVPWHAELALGAVAAGGARVVNDEVVARAGLDAADLEAAFARAQAEADRRERRLRAGRPALAAGGRQVIVVDDGIATGATIRVAAQLLTAADPPPSAVVLAVPVAPADTAARLATEVDGVVTLARPRSFSAVGQWYRSFVQVQDDEVEALVRAARSGRE